MRRFLLLLLTIAAPLAANDFAVSTPDGKSAWLLLQPPAGPAGEGLSEFAGDPGLPAPDVLGWAVAARPQLELWRFDGATGKYTLETRIAAKSTYLYAVFELGGEPFVLLSQGAKDAPTLILRARGLVTDSIAADRVALACPAFSDAPVVSPDESMLAVRAFPTSAAKAALRVYSTRDWKLIAESEELPFSRPVWVSNTALACLTTDAGISRVSHGDKNLKADGTPTGIPRVNDASPQKGKLLRLDVDGSSLKATPLLEGEFPPETFTRALARDAYSAGIILARKSGAKVVVERRDAAAGAEPLQIAAFDQFRGIAVSFGTVHCAGVVGGKAWQATVFRSGEIALPRLPFGDQPRAIRLPIGDKRETADGQVSWFTTSALGGLVDIRRGNALSLEPAANPDHAAKNATLCLHTIHTNGYLTKSLTGLDSLRNPRNLARVSGLAKRFAELDALYAGGIPSTQLAFDMTITLAKEQEKKGTYIEIFHGAGRGGKGRIRTEDNLGGNWVVNSIDGGGAANTDWVYSCANIKGGVMAQDSPARTAKLYNDMVTQLEARKLLMLGGIANAADKGGLRFVGRNVHFDAARGVWARVWEFEKLGAAIESGERQRVRLRFAADLPLAGGWQCPHSLLQADITFSLANQGGLAFTSVTFSTEKIVSLPNLTKKTDPPLLLPGEFWLHERDKETGKHTLRLHAVARTGEMAHPTEIVPGGKITPGYFLSPLSVPVWIADRADAVFRELRR